MWTISTLSDLRETVKESLENGLDGVKVFDYTESKWTPPVAIVTPDGMSPVVNGEGPFGSWNIPIKVVLIANNKGTSKVTAKALDDLIFQAIMALDDYDITDVSAPGEVGLRIQGQDVLFWGVVVTMEFITKLKEDN